MYVPGKTGVNRRTAVADVILNNKENFVVPSHGGREKENGMQPVPHAVVQIILTVTG